MLGPFGTQEFHMNFIVQFTGKKAGNSKRIPHYKGGLAERLTD
jgi:hypothetical protein